MTNGMIVRRAEERDIKEIAELEILCFPDPWSEDTIRKEITENAGALYIVAEAGEFDGDGKPLGETDIAGYMGVWKVVDEGHIMNVAVNPKYRRHHVGESIISCMLDITEQNGVTSWTLEVRKDNEPAIKLYEKLGFEVEGIRKGYYDYDNTDALLMWKRIEDEG